MIIISFHFSLAWYYKVPDSVNTTGAEIPVPLTSLTQFPVTVNAHGYEYSRLGIVLQFGKIDKLLLCTSLVAATCSNPMERRCDSVLSYWIEIGSYNYYRSIATLNCRIIIIGALLLMYIQDKPR